MTRDYQLDFENDAGRAPLLSVFGGKITTFRKLAEEALDQIAQALGNRRGAWTANACLPGGDLYGARPANRAVLEFAGYIEDLQQQYAWLPAPLVARYARAYGTPHPRRCWRGRSVLAQMGEEIAPGLFAAEVEYLVEHEWASCGADILWRRSKLGLHLKGDIEARLDAWLALRGTSAVTPARSAEQQPVSGF